MRLFAVTFACCASLATAGPTNNVIARDTPYPAYMNLCTGQFKTLTCSGAIPLEYDKCYDVDSVKVKGQVQNFANSVQSLEILSSTGSCWLYKWAVPGASWDLNRWLTFNLEYMIARQMTTCWSEGICQISTKSLISQRQSTIKHWKALGADGWHNDELEIYKICVRKITSMELFLWLLRIGFTLPVFQILSYRFFPLLLLHIIMKSDLPLNQPILITLAAYQFNLLIGYSWDRANSENILLL